ncbi:hypothetical protein MRX96_020036 [Rhipicephalus microplus]
MDPVIEELPTDREISVTSCVDAVTTEKTHLEVGESSNGREHSLSGFESQAGDARAMQNGSNGHLDIVPLVTASSVCDGIPVDITMQADGEKPSADGIGSNNNMDSEGFSQQVIWLHVDSAGGKSLNNSDSIEPDIVDMVRDIVSRISNCIEDVETVSCSSMDTDALKQPVDVVDSSADSPRKVQVLSKAPRVPYRDNEYTSSDSSSSSSSSESDTEVVTPMRRGAQEGNDSDCCSDGGEVGSQRTTTKPQSQGRGRTRNRGIKTPGELDIDDLPPIEDLHITLPRTELRQAGRVKHAVDQLLVVESERGQPVLDLDSVLFRADGTALGRVFDVLGPVVAPYYTVRFNTAQELTERALEPGEPVLYAPLHAEVTQYVLESEVRKQRGSDASWENNNEPPPEHLDFSGRRAGTRDSQAAARCPNRVVQRQRHGRPCWQRPKTSWGFEGPGKRQRCAQGRPQPRAAAGVDQRGCAYAQRDTCECHHLLILKHLSQAPHGPHANMPVGNSSYQPAGTASPHTPSSLLSPVYNSTGQRVPLYDPVPDLQRILATPPPPQPPPRC